MTAKQWYKYSIQALLHGRQKHLLALTECDTAPWSCGGSVPVRPSHSSSKRLVQQSWAKIKHARMAMCRFSISTKARITMFSFTSVCENANTSRKILPETCVYSKTRATSVFEFECSLYICLFGGSFWMNELNSISACWKTGQILLEKPKRPNHDKMKWSVKANPDFKKLYEYCYTSIAHTLVKRHRFALCFQVPMNYGKLILKPHDCAFFPVLYIFEKMFHD